MTEILEDMGEQQSVLAMKEFVRYEMVELRKDFADLRDYIVTCKN